MGICTVDLVWDSVGVSGDGELTTRQPNFNHGNSLQLWRATCRDSTAHTKRYTMFLFFLGESKTQVTVQKGPKQYHVRVLLGIGIGIGRTRYTGSL